jgi:enediyne biosynthesis protein E4
VALLAAMAVITLAGAQDIARGAGLDVTVKLRPAGALSVAQGRAFAANATLRNPDPESATVAVDFDLVDLASGDRVAFFTWQAVVPAQGSLSRRVAATTSQWFAGTGSFEIQASIQDVQSAALGFEVTAPAVFAAQFQDVTADAGVSTTVGPSECGGWAAGAAWGDVNGDGFPDLFLPRGKDSAKLWISDGAGHFTDEAAVRGVDDGSLEGMGAVFADYDNDGDQDLFVADRAEDRLYRNDGTGHFVDVAPAAGVAGSTDDVSAAWGDFDNDGNLDLYVVSNSPCAPPNMYDPDRLLHNNGDGTFTDMTWLLPSSATNGAGYQAAWFDYNGDGYQDLYLANDRWGPDPDPNHLWRNDGPGPNHRWIFTDVSADSRAGYFINSMGIGIADIDGDLDLDVAISNIGGNFVAANNGDGTFTNVAGSVGLQRPLVEAGVSSVTWGLSFTDLNLDGFEDLFAAAGSIYDQLDQPNQIFVAAGDGTFLDLSALSGAADEEIGRGIAVADYDRDGRPDVYVVNRAGAPILYRNVTPTSNHWVGVRLIGTTSNRDGCGARLVLLAGGHRQLREAFCGSVGLSSGNDAVIHLGLGSSTTVDRLTVVWPSGRRQVLRNLSADAIVDVTEPA